MKNYIPFTADFTALKAEILSSFEDDINAETLALHPRNLVFVAKSTSPSHIVQAYCGDDADTVLRA
jgi:hypothetical protein